MNLKTFRAQIGLRPLLSWPLMLVLPTAAVVGAGVWMVGRPWVIEWEVIQTSGFPQ